jgi:L-malate glycosyltransferase
MSSKPTILIIDNSIDLTGALKSIIRTAFNLQSFFEFVFVIPQNSKGRFWIKDIGLNAIYELPIVELSRRLSSLALYIPFLLVNAFRLIRLIEKENVSLMHVNDLYNLLPIVARALGNSTPYICHIRFMPDRFPPWLFNFWLKLHLRYAEKIVTVSQSAANLLPRHPKISVIYDVLPQEELGSLLPVEFKNKAYFVFLYLANFIAGKGQGFALSAFAEIHENLPNWKLRFVGSDMGLKKNMNYIRRLKGQAGELNIADKIEWTEFTNDVEWEYKHADIVLNFSESESFSKTCLEALYYGRPLIATDCGGPSEIIDHGVTGVLVPNRNTVAMAKEMMKMAWEKDRREIMGLEARMAVRKKFSEENTTLRLKSVYDQVQMAK